MRLLQAARSYIPVLSEIKLRGFDEHWENCTYFCLFKMSWVVSECQKLNLFKFKKETCCTGLEENHSWNSRWNLIPNRIKLPKYSKHGISITTIKHTYSIIWFLCFDQFKILSSPQKKKNPCMVLQMIHLSHNAFSQCRRLIVFITKPQTW